MKCPGCQKECQAGDKFCRECGTKLPSVCPNCGHEIGQQDRFCSECGTKLASTSQPQESPMPVATEADIPKLEDLHTQLRSLSPDEPSQAHFTPEEQTSIENRPVTALFADISGFTTLSLAQSSESIFQIVQECFRKLGGVIKQYDGIISGYRGDGLLALFGVPMHENDAERAILTAMDIRETMQGYDLEVSIGINTALMTVGEIQSQLHSEYTAYGSDINLAARLQQAADPGQILVGTGTYRLTRFAFDFEATEPMELKGFPQPVVAYSVRKAKAQPEKLRGIEGLRAQMIGREDEFLKLQEITEQWLQGQGQMASVIGEAGIGKSRLIKELREYLDSQSQDAQPLIHLEGRCVSIGQPISYWPFLDILRTYFGLSEDDTPGIIARKITDSISVLFPSNYEDFLPLLGRLFSIRFGNELDDRLKFVTPDQIQHQTLMRLQDIFEELARRQPLMLILEDLHWADDLSLNLISLLLDSLVTTQLMLLCVYRPEREHRCWQLSNLAQRKCWDRYTELMLKPLSRLESRRLVESLLAIDNLSESVREIILQKTEGNPFFIEEVIRSLMEKGLIYREEGRWKAKDEISDVDVPDTIQSVVLTRVDRMKSEARHVLQCASVIGRIFRYNLLSYITQKQKELDEYIAEFEDKDLVYEERSIPELEYAFKHALTQEATYQSILQKNRREFHHQVASGIERLYQERVEEYYEELAYHWGLSGDQEKALDYIVKAGDKATEQYASETAIKYYTQAIELVEQGVTSPFGLGDLYERRGKIRKLYCRYDDAIEDLKRAVNLTDKGSIRSRLNALIANIYLWCMGNSSLSNQHWEQANAELDGVDISLELLDTYMDLASAGFFSKQADIMLHKLVSIAERINNEEVLATAHALLSMFYYYHPDSERKLYHLERARHYLPALQRQNNPYALCQVYNELSIVVDNDAEVIEFLTEGIRLGEKVGYRDGMTYPALSLGNIYKRRGEVIKALEISRYGWDLCLANHSVRLSPSGTDTYGIGKNLIDLYLEMGGTDKVVSIFAELYDATIRLLTKPNLTLHIAGRWCDKVFGRLLLYLHEVSPEAESALQQFWDDRSALTRVEDELCFYYLLRMRYAFERNDNDTARSYARKIDSINNTINPIILNANGESHMIMNLLLGKSGQAEQFAYDYICSPLEQYSSFSPERSAHNFDVALIWIKQIYSGFPQELSLLCQRLEEGIPDALRRYGKAHLLMEPVKDPAEGMQAESIDDFSVEQLSSVWNWVDPKGDCSYEIEGYLLVHVPSDHDLWVQNFDAPRLLQPISGDFMVETKIMDGSNGKKSGGLFIWSDESSFARFEMASSIAWEGTVYYGALADGNPMHPGIHPFEAEEAYLRVERQGNRFTGYISSDGENWYRCGWVDMPMEDPIQVGIHALCPESPATSTRFEYFRIYRPE